MVAASYLMILLNCFMISYGLIVVEDMPGAGVACSLVALCNSLQGYYIGKVANE